MSKCLYSEDCGEVKIEQFSHFTRITVSGKTCHLRPNEAQNLLHALSAAIIEREMVGGEMAQKAKPMLNHGYGLRRTLSRIFQ